MIEKDIEKKIVDKIKSMKIDGLDVVGLWQSEESGVVKGVEKSSSPVGVAVSIPPMSFDTFSICEVTMFITITEVIRIDMVPNGDIVGFVEPISNMIRDWNLVQHTEELDYLKVDGFYPAGIQVGGGNGPVLDRSNKIWSIDFTFTLKGTITH